MKIDIELALKIGAFIISLSLLIKGIYEYTKAQKWKEVEFVSREVKEFFNDFDVKRALLMLDWNKKDVDLKPNEIEGKSKLHVDDALLMSALQIHRDNPVFKNDEVVIRGVFDVLFDRLTMFDIYIETGLIRTRDIKPYLIYWIQILADPHNDRKSAALRNQFRKYTEEYGFPRVKSLCARFGYEMQSFTPVHP